MSTKRLQDDRGFIDANKLARGPNGRRLCRRCHQEVPKRRITFCSDECVHQHKIRTQPGYVRKHVFHRDRGVCAICKLDTESQTDWKAKRWQADHIIPVIEGGGECGLENYRTLCHECHKKETAALRKRISKHKKAAPTPNSLSPQMDLWVQPNANPA